MRRILRETRVLALMSLVVCVLSATALVLAFLFMWWVAPSLVADWI